MVIHQKYLVMTFGRIILTQNPICSLQNTYYDKNTLVILNIILSVDKYTRSRKHVNVTCNKVIKWYSRAKIQCYDVHPCFIISTWVRKWAVNGCPKVQTELLGHLRVNQMSTRKSEMANTSPRHMPVLGNVHPIKIENFDIFSWRHFTARSSFYIINWYGYPRGSHEKYLKEIVSPVFEIRHWIVIC